MSPNSDRAAVHDLEEMLSKNLKIDKSPPRFNDDLNDYHIPGTPYAPRHIKPPETVSPTAVYNPAFRYETQAIPSPSVPTGMRASASMQSIHQQNQQQQQAYQYNDQYHDPYHQDQLQQQQQLQQRRLEQLRLEQEIQERELKELKKRELELKAQQAEDEAKALAQALAESEQQLEQEQQQRLEQHQQRLEQEQRLEQHRLEQQRLEQERLEHQQHQRLEQQDQRLEQQRRQSDSYGAATMLQRTQDVDGKVTTRIVKKGVEDFTFKEELGMGSYSTVVAAQDKQTLRQYAIKILDKAHIIKEQKVKYVEIEKLTLNRLGNHPGIIRLYFTFQDRQSLYFVLDFAPNGELLNLIKKIGSLNEECARYYSAQLLDAIDYMHKKGVIHRDLKPENILLDYKMRIKITDFGTAKLIDANEDGNFPSDVRCSSFVGTAEYVSPELLVGKSQGKSTDIWAWGCVLYQMIAASPPFQANTQFLTFQKIAKIQYSIPPGFPYIVRELLTHVLVKPQIRYTVDEIKEHEFFTNQDWSTKGVWGVPPPRFQPYRATVASMKPRPLASSVSNKNTKLVVPTRVPPSRVPVPQSKPTNNQHHSHGHSHSNSQSHSHSQGPTPVNNKQVFVPTSQGLQAVNPNTMFGMPVYVNRDTENNTNVQRKPSTNSQRSSSAKRQPATQKPTPSSAYQQSQEKIEALRRRMQEQRQASKSPTTSTASPKTHASSPNLAQPPNLTHRVVAQASNHSMQRPQTPKTPEQNYTQTFSFDSHLPLQPLTQLEAQYSNILVSSQERILRIKQLDVYVSSHPPPQTSSRVKHSEEVNDDEELVNIGEDGLLAKLSHAKMKKRIVIITTYGRLLILASDDRKVQYEVPLGLPQVTVKEVPFKIGKGSSATASNKIVVETYNRVFTLDEHGDNHTFLQMVELSRRYYAQVVADQERNSFNAAAAAASAVAGRRR